MGAWDFGELKAPIRAHDNPRLGACLVALKEELAFNGFGHNVVVETPVWGEAAENRLKEFQRSRGLVDNGAIGKTTNGIRTARELFRMRIQREEVKWNLPRGSLMKKISLESLFDPVCVGVQDNDDRGMCQINVRIHNVTIEQAYNPGFAVPWSARYMNELFFGVANRSNLWKAARVAYNTGEHYAHRWMMDGFPASGLVVNNIDWYARATNYWNAVEKQPT
jgi:hypothetical protein